MKHIILTILLLCSCVSTVYGAKVPELRGHINDYANVLKPQEIQQLEQVLINHEKTDANQIVVLIIPSLEGDVLEEYSMKVAEIWKIGTKKIDNGVLLVIAMKEHKLRIEVGRGLEGKLTDLMSGRIIRGEITPAFKEGKIAEGVSKGVNAIMATVKGEYKPGPETKASSSKKNPDAIKGKVMLGLIIIVIAVLLGAIHWFICGAVGAVGGAAMSWLFISQAMPVLVLAAVIGFIVCLLAQWMAQNGIGLDGGGGWSSGGGSSGGGFSGGGGDFGGGGSSGDW